MPKRCASEAKEPAIHLTEVAVQRLKPDPSRRREIRDAQTRGLVLRITPEGKKTWSVLLRVSGAGENAGRGPTRRATLGSHPLIDLKAARERAYELLSAAERGRDPLKEREQAAQERQSRTVAAVVERFITVYARVNTKNWRATDHLLRTYVVPHWGARPIDEITRRDAHDLLDRFVAQGRISIAREVRKHLTRLFNWSVDRDILKASPLAGMERREIAYRPRERFLDMAELKRIWDATDRMGYPFGPLFKLLLLTGQRKSEIASARRAWVLADSTAMEIPSEAYKTGRPHVVPFSPAARSVLEALPSWTVGDFLFSTTAGRKPVSGFSKAKIRIDRLSGVKNWTIHDLRRSVATHMARLGVMQEHIERVLGHAIEGVAGTYNRYSYLAEKRTALEIWGREWRET